MNKRDINKRLKGFGIPIELCVKYERMAGVKPGEEPTKKQQEQITKLMVTALTLYVAHIVLTSRDYEEIAQEVKRMKNAVAEKYTTTLLERITPELRRRLEIAAARSKKSLSAEIEKILTKGANTPNLLGARC